MPSQNRNRIILDAFGLNAQKTIFSNEKVPGDITGSKWRMSFLDESGLVALKSGTLEDGTDLTGIDLTAGGKLRVGDGVGLAQRHARPQARRQQ